MDDMNLSRPSSTRRKFLTTGAGAGLTILPSTRTAFSYEANERLNLAVFGHKYNAQSILPSCHVNNLAVVALCDPDRAVIEQALSKFGSVAAQLETGPTGRSNAQFAESYRKMSRCDGIGTYDDIRRLFDRQVDSFDALVVANLDQFHGTACRLALESGKPVCTERPLGLNIEEARSLSRLAAEKQLPVTYRSPGTGKNEFRRAMELVEDGAIGPVKEVHIWFDRGGPDRNALPKGSQSVPAGLNWDTWLGPLPDRPYHKDWKSYAHWRETCNGGLGVFGMHTTIFPFMALKLHELWNESANPAPIRVSAECSRTNPISFPKWERVRWEIPARRDMPPVTITWHHGPGFAPGAGELVREKLGQFGVTDASAAAKLMKKAGSMLIGSDGALVGSDHSATITVLPAEKFAGVEKLQPQRIAPTRGIYRDWFDACRGSNKPEILASFENGGALSELVMLGNIATRFPEQSLAYDPGKDASQM